MKCLALLISFASIACGSSETVVPTMLAGPEILSPNQRVVVPETMQIQAEAGAEKVVSTDYEVWTSFAGDRDELAWQLNLVAGQQSGGLSQGIFSDDRDDLDPWRKYIVRARYRVASGPGEWGPDRRFRTDDGSEAIFNSQVIRDVRLTIPESSWGPIDDEALSECEPHPRSYYPGALTIEGAQFPGSGVRAKGGCGSSRSLDDKAAFKINLSWDDPAVEGCADTRRFMGLKKITLNNQVEDQSYTHERIGYDFFQKMGVPVSRSAPVRVYVNDELWGLYLHIESIDRRFLSRRFDSKKGMLYEAGYGCDLGGRECFEPKFSTDACDTPQPDRDPTDYTPLDTLNTRLEELAGGQFYPQIDDIVDFDAFLSLWAAAAIMGYWDGYPNDGNNYRIYHNPSDDRWTLIPSGLDQLFEEESEPFEATGMLATRCLAESACKDAFLEVLSDALDLFEASDYPAMARAIETQITAEVEADPRKEFSVQEWHDDVDSTIEFMRSRPTALRELLE